MKSNDIIQTWSKSVSKISVADVGIPKPLITLQRAHPRIKEKLKYRQATVKFRYKDTYRNYMGIMTSVSLSHPPPHTTRRYIVKQARRK